MGPVRGRRMEVKDTADWMLGGFGACNITCLAPTRRTRARRAKRRGDPPAEALLAMTR